jgi:hypothetical protein
LTVESIFCVKSTDEKAIESTDEKAIEKSALSETGLHKLFERGMCSGKISGIIQNNLVAPKSKANQVQ